ncbi:hypothetical protein FB565_004030 [Actinoplanes lutulentus]|uniref:AAA domain-containing protein n=1 Tax=Actinoplanes lutulentus TaxID=1287878 RepID=A0A327ZKC8_9ACTN|nr:DUF3320 domain-containing protein [Actinoplanes lutulentus]MBB2944301.1 hypothetical protein [Actinoplanes lutulentus]RAK42466.1 AAA domain-containing protein [Actinoplanes lutulentus]
MRPDDAEGPTGPGDDARAALAAWRDGIGEPGPANRLLNLPRGGADLVEIVAPDASGVLTALSEGKDWVFGDGRLRVDLPDEVLHPLLRRLRRHALAEQADRGVEVLHLAAGLLHWQDSDGTGYASPIQLVPVELVALGPDDVPSLRAGSGDPIPNPALATRLAKLGVDIAELNGQISSKAGWRTDNTLVLARFDVAAEEIRRDLSVHADAAAGHPVVRALATGTANAFTFAPITAAEIDTLAPPEDTPLVLDADADQRACVAAALDGHSFVIDGPPGTGKSQTVANLIGALAHAGKRVLFVSEKAAALDTVQHRLSAAGLGNHLLDLHGSKIARRSVASALAAALDAAPTAPGPGMPGDEREALRAAREKLNAYAEAVNEIREPLGKSLHDVVGALSGLNDLPDAPTAGIGAAALTSEALDRVRAAAENLAAAWRPANERSGFRWREVLEKESLDEALQLAQIALDDLAGASTPNAAIATAFHLRLPSDAPALAEAAEHAAKRPPEVQDSWLTTLALRPVRQAAEDLERLLDEVTRAVEQAEARTGVSWETLAAPLDAGRIPEPHRLIPPAVRLEPLTAADAKSLASRFAADADELEHQQRRLDRVTTRLRLPDVVMFTDVELVTLIADLGGRPDKPLTAWFSPGAQSAVHGAAAQLRRHVEAVAAARAEADAYFTDAVLREPVEELAERFATVHRGARKLLAPHRRDKEAVAGFTRPDVSIDEAVVHLDLAVAWRRAHEGLVAAERQHAASLGRYWKRLDTDFRGVGRALETAAEVLRVAPTEALPAVIGYVTSETGHDEELLLAVTEARDVFRHWRSTLRPEPEPAARPELGQGTVHDGIAWLRAQVGTLGETATLLDQLGRAVGRDLNVAEARTVLVARQAVLDAEDALNTASAGYRAALGDAYQGRRTDLRALGEAIDWAARARTLRTGTDAPLNSDQMRALGSGGSRPADLLPLIAAWQEARQRILDAFGPARQVRLATTLDRYETARDLLRDLREDDTGQREWFDYLDAREILAEHGLDGVVDFCADHAVDVRLVPDVIERTAYRAWAEDVVASDERLEPLAAGDRNELVDVFHRLDAGLLQDAASAVIQAVHRRRPKTPKKTPPTIALIRAEGQKQKGHLPVRQLLGEVWEAAAALKPCFLMPPAAAGRFLPDQARFDVVIVDEASRMTPAALVSCARRGTSLIIVGDDAQLPPAGDQPSALVVANDCGAFTRIGLTRHYRSRHESLIDFANQAFYQGRLITFPGALPPGPDIGVELFGVGHGGSEADYVAERVVHHFNHRPTLSIGVVTLTAGQADTIADAVETTLAGDPDLERFLGDVFVKDAETAQGDERDVIILATGASLDAAGGPTGARRLNVAITRARQRVEVVSAIPARAEPAGEGERKLSAYLENATSGTAQGERGDQISTALEDSVLETITGWGFAADAQVGVGPGRVAVGVRGNDADDSGYVLGVLCDGPGHAAPVARDRDRLGDQVLHSLGWSLHRIWSVPWYRDRAQEEARLRVAIENALAVPDVFAEADEELLAIRPAPRPEWALPYERATVGTLPASARANDDVARALLVQAVERVAELEGPVHLQVLTRRIREAWGISRLTQGVKTAIDVAIRSSSAGFDGTFVTAPDAPIPAVRVPADGVNRKPDQVAEPELQLALEYLVLDAGLVEGEDLLAAAGRLFGWSGNRAGASRLAQMLDDLVSAGRLIAHRSGLIAAPEEDQLDLPDPASLPHRDDAKRRSDVSA